MLKFLELKVCLVYLRAAITQGQEGSEGRCQVLVKAILFMILMTCCCPDVIEVSSLLDGFNQCNGLNVKTERKDTLNCRSLIKVKFSNDQFRLH